MIAHRLCDRRRRPINSEEMRAPFFLLVCWTKARRQARKLLRQSTSKSTFSITFPFDCTNLLQEFTIHKVIEVAPEQRFKHTTTQHTHFKAKCETHQNERILSTLCSAARPKARLYINHLRARSDSKTPKKCTSPAFSRLC